MISRAPTIGLYRYLLRNKSERCQKISYQVTVLIITFFTYTAYHMAKRPFSVVKGELGPNCTVTEFNNTCFPWKPFNNPSNNNDLFGLLDFAFLAAYALTMFISGYVAEHTNLRLYLSIGMISTGALTAVFGGAYYFHVHSLYFFFLLQVLTGITQSSGWPCVVEAVGSWFPEGRRGFVMGVWNTHVSVGNILGSLIAGAFVKDQWGLSFIVPGVIIGGLGIVVFLFLIPDPALVHLDGSHSHESHSDKPGNSQCVSDNLDSALNGNCDVDYEQGKSEEMEELQAIGICDALKIPGVVEYSLCLFFAKLVSYTFLFWLPFYIGKITIAGKHFGPEKAADWSVFFDVGGMLGGIVAGALTDFTHCPGIVNVVMLILAAPVLFLFKFHGQATELLFVFFMSLSGFFVNGPYALITTAVSASLGNHECLQGNTKAMAVVTAIIDATGSLGAAVGPLLAGLISDSGSWADVFYMLIAADILAALLLTRQFLKEARHLLWRSRRSLGRSRTFNSIEESSEKDPLMSAD